jgi:hypothetical protein
MRRLLACALLLAGVPGAVSADDRGTALTVLERSIKAHGGADGLTRAQVSARSATGVVLLGGEIPFRTEVVTNLPGQVRITVEVNKAQMVTVVNPDRGWQQSAGGAALDLGKERLAEQQEEVYLRWIATLVPLLKDDFDLRSLPEAKVDGRPAAGIRAAHKGRPDIALYFDKQTNLLVKIACRAREGGVAVDKEYLFSDHKDFEGVKLQSKEVMTINDRKTAQLSYTSYKFLRKPDESAFVRP